MENICRWVKLEASYHPNISVTLYENNKAMERATATKNKVIDSIQGIVSIDTKVGSVILNHNNSLKHKTTKSKYSLKCEGGFINV